jgi:hypothetical protein
MMSENERERLLEERLAGIYLRAVVALLFIEQGEIEEARQMIVLCVPDYIATPIMQAAKRKHS